MTAGQNVVALITAWHEKELEAFAQVLNALDDDELRECVSFLVAQSYAVYETTFWRGFDHEMISDLIQKLGARIA